MKRTGTRGQRREPKNEYNDQPSSQRQRTAEASRAGYGATASRLEEPQLIRTLAIPWRIGLASVLLAIIGLVAAIPWAWSAMAANATVGVGAPGGLAVFTPNVINISVGDSVTFNWVDGVHDAKNAVTGDTYLPLSTGPASQTTTFTTPGTYYFYCTVHAKASDATEANIASNAKQVGKIVVTAAASPTPTSTTPTTTATPTATPKPATTPVVPPPLTVVMPADYFNPVGLVVNLGDTVTFKNTDTDLHTVVSVPGNSPVPINLTVKSGESATFTFNTPGLYWYYCNAHATWDSASGQVKGNDTVDDPREPMEGFILVKGPVAAAPSAATVTMPGDSFVPFVTTVQAGSEVTFKNTDTDLHTIISVPGNSAAPINLTAKAGESARFTFTAPGLYWYFCNAHATWDPATGQVEGNTSVDNPREPMMGVVAVVSPPPAPPVTPPPATPPRPPSTGNGLSAGEGTIPIWLLGSSFLLAGIAAIAAAKRRLR